MSQTIKLDNSLPVYSRYKAQKIIIGKYIAYLVLYLEIFFFCLRMTWWWETRDEGQGEVCSVFAELELYCTRWAARLGRPRPFLSLP